MQKQEIAMQKFQEWKGLIKNDLHSNSNEMSKKKCNVTDLIYNMLRKRWGFSTFIFFHIIFCISVAISP